ncbi:class I SAM-dependent methyltransferase [Arthrobacter sp. ATA002]|uniref:class I SAM-dependent methyltransferase n=1 Tax=Arthrobacter sp. ATA002 TaxID=2991715 RepID=UPI0022A75CA0|nr:class I SAM-dependent methyltransferase [Arthrobacter sp. ATA002]WAP50948.1 class I SAM-dependent methyltransferase [Arthrobacter sp. ATA002]
MTAAPVIPDRIRWAVGLLGLSAGDRVLEIGCGPGAAAELICPLLDTGFLLAVDRSATAVARARSRNASHRAAGRLEVLEASLAQLPEHTGTFDVAFAVNVNVFWTDPAGPELDVLFRVLRPDGRLAILYGPGPLQGAGSAAHTGVITDQLRSRGFRDARTLLEERGTGVICRRN